MRRVLVGIAAIGALAVLATAARAGIAAGVRGGLSFSGYSWESIVLDPETKFGPGGGAFVTIGAGDLFSFQAEVLYVSKGASWGESETTDEVGNPTGTFEVLHVVDYLEVPILLRLTPPVGGAIRPVLSLGPSVAFDAAERIKTVGDFRFSQEVDYLRNTDFGVALGLGFELVGGGGIWSLDGRYTHGLRNLERVEEASSVYKNWNMLVSIGFARAIQ